MTVELHPLHAADLPSSQPAWLVDAADLLAEPDPGPTAWLVQDLIVDQAIIAAVGRWKTTKSYGLLDLCISIATGEPAFGVLEIPNPGPVIFVNEESGRAALWRRLDALCRGRAINPERLRGRLLLGANARIKLDDEASQLELLELGVHVQPRLYVFDPLARMKDPGREENEQSGMAPLIDFIRQLRDETKAAVSFVHHTGHAGEHMRGSSDLESVWETRLRWRRDGQSPLVTIESEHREAEAATPLDYRIAWDTQTRSMRFTVANNEPDMPPLRQRIIEWVDEHRDSKARDIAKGLGVRATAADRELALLVAEGALTRGPSGRTDKLGRPVKDVVYNPSGGSAQPLFPDTPRTTHGTSHDGSAHTPDNPGRATNRTNTKPINQHESREDVAAPEYGTTHDISLTNAPWLRASSHPLRGDRPDEPPDEPHDHLAYLELINDTEDTE
jgi:hypothetical protein